jgi:hypothetical protein
MRVDSFEVTVHDDDGDAALEFDERSGALRIGVADGRYILSIEYGGRRREIRVVVKDGLLLPAAPALH